MFYLWNWLLSRFFRYSTSKSTPTAQCSLVFSVIFWSFEIFPVRSQSVFFDMKGFFFIYKVLFLTFILNFEEHGWAHPNMHISSFILFFFVSISFTIYTKFISTDMRWVIDRSNIFFDFLKYIWREIARPLNDAGTLPLEISGCRKVEIELQSLLRRVEFSQGIPTAFRVIRKLIRSRWLSI